MTDENLYKLKEIPITQQDIYTMSSEGMTFFDVVAMFMDGANKDEMAILGRTVLDKEETVIVAELLYTAKYGLMCDGTPPTEKWAIPELKDIVFMVLRARPSINGNSREQAKETLGGIRIQMDNKSKTMSQV